MTYSRKYDVFISYRRDGADGPASRIYDRLRDDGYRVAFDLESLRSGNWDEQILQIVRQCKDVLVVLSPGALDRCIAWEKANPGSGAFDENDWMRREVACALASGKNVIPVMLRDFTFPPSPSLPSDIRDLPRRQAIDAFTMKRFDGTMKELESFLKSWPVGRFLKRIGFWILNVTILVAIFHFASLIITREISKDASLEKQMNNHRSEVQLLATNASDKCSDEIERSIAPDEECVVGKLNPGTTIAVHICEGFDMEMVWCPPGKFVMGSPLDETGRDDDETLHSVQLSHGFWIGKYPITQRQWRVIENTNPSWFKKGEALSEDWRVDKANDALFDRDNNPVEHVSWIDCTNYLAKVSFLSGRIFRLPTEAEWEYACRANTKEAFPWGVNLNGDFANVDGTKPYASKIEGPYLRETSPVGAYYPNSWGIFDMNGNVFEWVNDYYGDYALSATIDPSGPSLGSQRVIRGGNWDNSARVARSANRGKLFPTIHNARTGFRACMSDDASFKGNHLKNRTEDGQAAEL